MIDLHNVSKDFGGDSILTNVSFRISPGAHVGLIGANGSGKTTLLRILAGHLIPDRGEVIRTAPIRSALLAQEVTVKSYNTLLAEMKRALPEVIRLEEDMRTKEEEMILWARDEERMETLVAEYALLQERFEHYGGDDFLWKIDCVIQGLGFSLKDRERKVCEFSGGWQMRIELAKLLLKEVDLLLLDEPTNHLDLAATKWLEEYLREYPGALIIVSHDRRFLNRLISRTIHIERCAVTSYSGNYDSFYSQRKAAREIQEHAYLEQQKKLAHDQRFIERFRFKARLASRVKSREKMLERLDRVSAPPDEEKTIRLSFSFEESRMTSVFSFRDLQKDYGTHTVSLTGEVEIRAGERVAIIGENGSGKTTLLRILSGAERSFRGRLKVHESAVIGFYEQNHQTQLRDHHTVIESLQWAAPPDHSVTRIRTLLGRFLFQGDDVFKKVEVLSGGEKARLSLAQIVCSSSNVLLLDEPTNHLDIDSRESLAESIDEYEGTVLVVSHDRHFIDQVCTRVLVLEKGELRSYPGNYSFYEKKREEESRAKASGLIPGKGRAAGARRAKTPPSPERAVRKQIAEIEERISALEAELKEIERSFQDSSRVTDRHALQQLSEEYALKKNEIEALFERYEALHESIPGC